MTTGPLRGADSMTGDATNLENLGPDSQTVKVSFGKTSNDGVRNVSDTRLKTVVERRTTLSYQ